MKRSSRRILTTHVGSLPRAPALADALQRSEMGEPSDAIALGQMVRGSVDAVVARQTTVGIDVVNDGEHSKSSFAAYTANRLEGFEQVGEYFGYGGATRDRLAFPSAYADHREMWAARTLHGGVKRKRGVFACTGPVRYKGAAAVATDIANLKAATAAAGRPVEEAFVTALSPNNVSLYYPNKFYRSEQEYNVALADAMSEEYRAIAGAGLVLQIDDPRMATHYDRHPDISLEDCRRFIAEQVELINYALRGIPEEQVRFHTCYSTNIAPRAHDLELKHYVDLMLGIKAGAYSFEAANPRHEHEWQVWEQVRLPDDKLLIPGVVSHCVSLIEHPELVAQRIARFASVIGRERVIASNDCGFATSAAGDEVHPDVAWAKLESLVVGARLASAQLWP